MKRSPLKRKTKLKAVSKKRSVELREYSALRKDYLARHPMCEYGKTYTENRVEGRATCSEFATDIHHRKRRYGKTLNDTRFWMGVCRPHHQWIESNGRESRERGYIL